MTTSQSILIKRYHEKYEQLLQNFENESAQEISDDFPESFVKTKTVFRQKYSEKSKQYS